MGVESLCLEGDNFSKHQILLKWKFCQSEDLIEKWKPWPSILLPIPHKNREGTVQRVLVPRRTCAWCNSLRCRQRAGSLAGIEGMRSEQPTELRAPGVSPVECWAMTESEGVLEAANQQIPKSNKVLAVIKRGR